MLAALGVDHADDAPPVGRDAQVGGAVVAAPELEAAALEQVGDAAGPHIKHQQVRHPVLGQVVVPVAVHRIFGGKGRFLALAHLRGLAFLGRLAAQMRPDPGNQGDALPVGKPLEGLHPGRHLGRQPGLAAVGCDQVELGLRVLDPLTLASRGKGNPLAGGRKLRLAVLLALRQGPGLATQGRKQPQTGAAQVVLHRGPGHGAHRLGAIGAEAGCAQPLQLPEQIDSHSGRWGGGHGAIAGRPGTA